MSNIIDKSNAMNSEAIKQVMPPQTQKLDNKVLGSRNTAAEADFVDNGPPREGDTRAITTSTPVEQRRMSGNSSPAWPTTKSNFMFYGKAK